MIIIWDNGGSHSDHMIYFVDCGPLTADDVASFARLAFGGDGFEIARADSIDWRDTEELATPASLAHHVDALFTSHDTRDLSGITTPALEYLIGTFKHVSRRICDELERRLK